MFPISLRKASTMKNSLISQRAGGCILHQTNPALPLHWSTRDEELKVTKIKKRLSNDRVRPYNEGHGLPHLKTEGTLFQRVLEEIHSNPFLLEDQSTLVRWRNQTCPFFHITRKALVTLANRYWAQKHIQMECFHCCSIFTGHNHLFYIEYYILSI